MEKEPLLLLGGIYSFRLFDSAKAIDAFTRVTQLDPRYKLGYNYLAYEYCETGEWDKSQEAIDRYIQLVPDESNPYDTKADLYAVAGKTELAIDAFETAIRKKSDQMWSHRKVAALLALAGRYEDAGKHLRIMATSDDRWERSWGRQFLAWLPAHQGKFEAALDHLDQAIAADKIEFGREVSFYPHLLKGLIYMERREPDLALSEMEMATAPAHPDPIELGRVVVLAETGRFDRAEAATYELERRVREAGNKDVFAVWAARGLT